MDDGDDDDTDDVIDEDTDGDHDDDTDDGNDRKNDSYTVAGAAPGDSVPCSLFLVPSFWFLLWVGRARWVARVGRDPPGGKEEE